MGDLDLEGRISFKDESASGVAAVIGRLDKIIESLDKVGEHSRHAAEHSKSFADEMVTKFAEVAAAAFSVEKAFEFMVEGIRKADEIRDLTLSLGVFSGSMQKGVEAMEFFNKAARETRDTGDDLAKVYRDVLPLAISRGFSQDSMQHITVWMSQLATISGQSLDAMESGFQQLLSGRVSPGRNPLLKVLGITKADVADLGWDQLVTKMEEVSKHFPEFGQSWQSTMAKAKDALLDAFGEGFNEARGEAGKGMAGIEAAIKEATPYIRDLGKYIAELAPTAIRAFEGAGGALRVFFGGIETGAALIVASVATMISQVVGAVGGALSAFLASAAAFERAMPPWMWSALKVMNPSLNLDRGADQMAGIAEKIKAGTQGIQGSMADVVSAMSPSMEHGAEQVRAGIEMITKAQEPLADATHKTTTETAGLNDEMKQMLGTLGNVAVDSAAEKKMDKWRMSIEKATLAIEEQIKAIDAQNYATDQAQRLAESHLNTFNPVSDTYANAQLEYQAALAENAKKAADQFIKEREAIKGLGDGSPEVAKLTEDINKLQDSLDEHAALRFKAAVLAVFTDLHNVAMGFTYEELRHTQSAQSPMPLLHLNDDVREQIAVQMGKLEARSFRESMLNSSFINDFGGAIASIARSGGRNFVEVIAGGLDGVVQTSAKHLADAIFGVPGDPKKGQDANKLYSPDGKDITTRAVVGRGIATGAEVAISGYQAGLSGQSGARTGAVISGAVAGAEFGLVGAAVGAIIGAIAGALGAQERQSEYKYGIPRISDGVATFTGARNIQTAQQEQIRNQIQESYDSMRDQLVNVFMRVPGAVIPGRTTIGGPIQPEPSGHFMEHLQQWIDQTLPKQQLGEFANEATNVATSLGMSAGRFGEIWKHLEGIDPKKVPGILDQLFSSLLQLQQTTTYWAGSDLAHATSPVSNGRLDFANNAMWYGADQEHKPMTAQFTDIDRQIVQLGTHIKDLSPQGQIAAFQQLTGLMRQRDEMLKAAAIELYNLAKSVKDELSSDRENLDVQRLRNPDGTPDQYAIAQYYRQRAEQDLFAISSASNPEEARQAWERFRHDVMSAEQAGFSQATEEEKNGWINWADNLLGVGQNAITTAINRFGGTINEINNAFNAQVDPAIEAFTTAITNTGGSIGGVGEDLEKIREPIRGVGDGMTGLVTDIANVRAEVVAFGEYLSSIRGNKSDSLSTTIAGRGAA